MAPDAAAGLDPKAAIRERFTQRAEHFAAGAGSDLPAVLELTRQLALSGTEDVIDVATGGGALAIALAPHARRVLGVDLTPAMLEQARAAARDRGLDNLSFVQGDVEALPAEAAVCDVVTSCRAVHHFQDMERSFAEMRRVLRPGGRLGIVDFSTFDDPAAAAFLEGLEGLREHGGMSVLPATGWPARLRGLGFHVRSLAWFLQPTSLQDWLRRVGDRPGVEPQVRAAFERAPQGVRQAIGLVDDGNGGLAWLRPYVVLVAARAG